MAATPIMNRRSANRVITPITRPVVMAPGQPIAFSITDGLDGRGFDCCFIIATLIPDETEEKENASVGHASYIHENKSVIVSSAIPLSRRDQMEVDDLVRASQNIFANDNEAWSEEEEELPATPPQRSYKRLF